MAACYFENIQDAVYFLLILKSLNCLGLSKRLITYRTEMEDSSTLKEEEMREKSL